ncbi:MAG: response regulator [Planctomycetota bacterium]
MTNKVLVVDDEPALVDSIARALGLEFDITTALSGPQGLEAIEQSGPFAVVVTDMRMPGMDGVQYIRRAREAAPDSVYLMLTGNQDIATAMRAVNEGEVFRFLNKPSSTEELTRAINAALRYHALAAAEKELLNRTFVGAVSAITTVFDTALPELGGLGAGFSGIVSAMCAHADIEERWEFKLASRLAPMGFALVDDGMKLAKPPGANALATERERWEQAAAGAANLFAKIPRLETVGKIIRAFPHADGVVVERRPTDGAAIVSVGSSLLRVAAQSHFALGQGVSGKVLVQELREALPQAYRPLLEALEEIEPWADLRGIELPPDQLRPGMVLADDLTSSGKTLVRRGRRLSEEAISHAAKGAGPSGQPMRVVVTLPSFEAFPPISLGV